MIEIQLGFETKSKAIYIRLADSTYLLVEVFLSDVIHVEVSVKCIKPWINEKMLLNAKFICQ